MIKVSNALAAEIAMRCSDAYSFDRYSQGAWVMCAKKMAQRGFDAQQIEAVLRSKWMRWAGDAANRNSHVTSNDLMKYLDHMGGAHKLSLEVEKLTVETFPERRRKAQPEEKPLTGADLAGACEGEQIAELIDVALQAQKGGTIIDFAKLSQRATTILEEIKSRAK